ncbi:hypothetical protein P4133_33530 [Pseudomonas aeruginosa]|nr:hypothetical protein [Pseudomonas aeruginosa]
MLTAEALDPRRTGGAGKGAAVEDGEEQLDGIAGKVHGHFSYQQI